MWFSILVFKISYLERIDVNFETKMSLSVQVMICTELQIENKFLPTLNSILTKVQSY